VNGAAEIMNCHGAIKVEELIGREPVGSRTADAGLHLATRTCLPRKWCPPKPGVSAKPATACLCSCG